MGGLGGISFLNWVAEAGTTLPPHWSPQRDQELRRFAKGSDHVSGAINTLRDMATAMDYQIVPRDPSVRSHHRLATKFENSMKNSTRSRGNFVAQGWAVGYGPAVQDFYNTDNGFFMAVEGPGKKLEDPLLGQSEGPLLPGVIPRLIHLDSARCQRTQYPEFPVLYTDLGGAQFFIHHSRVIVLAGQSDPDSNLLGVGFCAVSRVVGVAQNLIDMSHYKQEKLGSRPKRALLVISGGGNRQVKAVENQLAKADEAMNNKSLRRFSPIPIVAITKSDGEMTLLDLNSIPDGFDERTSTELGYVVLANAFGVDTRQLAMALGTTGQTKADAVVQHSKMQGKGPATLRQDFKAQLEAKFLPPVLKLVWIHNDDLADKAKAEIAKLRSESRQVNLQNGVTTPRVERETMLEEGTLTQEQFIQLELEDGRTEDGENILILFQSPEMQELLPVGLDAEEEELEQAIIEVQGRLFTTPTAGVRSKVKLALAALEFLRDSKVMVEEAEEQQPDEENATIEEDEDEETNIS